MALSVQSSLLAKRRAMSYANGLKPGVVGLISWLFQYFSQFKGNPDLLFVPFSGIGSNTVIAAEACKLYAIVLQKVTATASYFKGTNNATTAATNGSQDLTVLLSGAGNSTALIYPDGLSLSTGLTIIANTTTTGSVSSGADAPTGFALIGNP